VPDPLPPVKGRAALPQARGVRGSTSFSGQERLARGQVRPVLHVLSCRVNPLREWLTPRRGPATGKDLDDA